MTAVSFYTGHVTHRRFSEIGHKLKYRIAYLLIDLDRLSEADAASSLLSINRPGLMSFRSQDHGVGSPGDLATWVRSYLKDQNVAQAAAKIRLLTLPRMFGFVFNPISVYFIADEEDQLHHVMYQVSNTFGERHIYLCPVDSTRRVIDQSADKALYVSPFFDVEGTYQFKLQPPGETVALTIRYTHADATKALDAVLTGTRQTVTTLRSLRVLFAYPFMTLGVVAGIHWEAFKLWIKGAKYRSKQKAAAQADSGPV